MVVLRDGQTKVRSASAPIIQAPTVSKCDEPALQLLGHGVDVAEAALQRMALEDRGGAGGIVGEVDRLARLVDGVGRGHADGDAMVDRELSPAEICFQISAIDCSRKARAERMPTSAWARLVCTTALSRSGLTFAARDLVPGHVDEAVEAGARDAQRHAGEAHLVAGHRRHAVERAGLAAFLGRTRA